MYCRKGQYNKHRATQMKYNFSAKFVISTTIWCQGQNHD